MKTQPVATIRDQADRIAELEAEVRRLNALNNYNLDQFNAAFTAAEDARGDVAHALHQRDQIERQLLAAHQFMDFVLKWLHRGPPHGGPGNEAQVLSAIAGHPVLLRRRAALSPPDNKKAPPAIP